MLDYRILGPGKVTYDQLAVDPSVPMADQAGDLLEDLLQVAYANGVILDVGWYPERSAEGQFWVSVVVDSDWSQPRFDRNCKDYQALIELIRTGAEVAEWYGRGDEPLSLTLQADNDAPVLLTPTWTSVMDALIALDGQEKTLTCLAAPDGTTLMIGGGNNGRFLVNLLVDPETQEDYVLTDPAATGPDAELCCGGQTSDYPAHWCVDLRLVLEAAHHFIIHSDIAPALRWEKDRSV